MALSSPCFRGETSPSPDNKSDRCMDCVAALSFSSAVPSAHFFTSEAMSAGSPSAFAMSLAVMREGLSDVASSSMEFFWDSNTVEMQMLGCAILVCLAGIMFGSSRLRDSTYYEADRAFVTWSVLLVLTYSMAYWGTVFCSEVFSLVLRTF